MKFDLEDMRQFADRHRGKYITRGPHSSTIMRFPILFDEYEKANTRAAAAESALISMVQQYCYRPLDADGEPAEEIYQHDFMSAGEEAFAYLVEHGLARWTDDRHYAIELVEGGKK